MSTKTTGNYGETLAVEYLKKLGFKILKRNYRIRGGEIDIVARDKEDLVFVEVKARWSHEYGLPAESITPWKIKFLMRTALFYLVQHKLGDIPYRIDVVSVDFTEKIPSAGKPKIELFKNITS